MQLEMGLCGLTVLGAGLGGWSLYWARNSACATRNRWGRGLFLATLLALGGAAIPAAYFATRSLTWLGLCLGLLVTAMLWEVPATEDAIGDHGATATAHTSEHQSEAEDLLQRAA